MTSPRRQPSTTVELVASAGLATTIPATTEPLDRMSWATAIEEIRQERLHGLLATAIHEGTLAVTSPQRAEAAESHAEAAAWVLVLERRLLTVAEALTLAGIELRVLKGPAVATLDYPDPGMRCFADVDICVPGAQFGLSVRILESLGGHRRFPEPRPGFDERFTKGASFRFDDGTEIDLHRTLCLGWFGLALDTSDLFEPGAPFRVGDVGLTALAAALRLVHACLHASLGDEQPRLLPLRDVVQLAAWRSSIGAVLELACRWRCEVVVADAVKQAWTRLGVTDEHPLFEWASRVRTEQDRAASAGGLPRRSSLSGPARTDGGGCTPRTREPSSVPRGSSRAAPCSRAPAHPYAGTARPRCGAVLGFSVNAPLRTVVHFRRHLRVADRRRYSGNIADGDGIHSEPRLSDSSVTRSGAAILLLIAPMLLFAWFGWTKFPELRLGVPIIAILEVLAVVATRRMNDGRNFDLAGIVLAGFAMKLVFVALRYNSIYATYNGVGDSEAYHENGVRLAKAYRMLDFSEPANQKVPGTGFIRIVTGYVYAIFAPKIAVGYIVYGLFGFVGCYLLYKAFELAVPGGDRRRYALLIFFWPSMLFWPGSIGKEAWVLLGIGMFAYGGARSRSCPRGLPAGGGRDLDGRHGPPPRDPPAVRRLRRRLRPPTRIPLRRDGAGDQVRRAPLPDCGQWRGHRRIERLLRDRRAQPQFDRPAVAGHQQPDLAGWIELLATERQLTRGISAGSRHRALPTVPLRGEQLPDAVHLGRGAAPRHPHRTSAPSHRQSAGGPAPLALRRHVRRVHGGVRLRILVDRQLRDPGATTDTAAPLRVRAVGAAAAGPSGGTRPTRGEARDERLRRRGVELSNYPWARPALRSPRMFRRNSRRRPAVSVVVVAHDMEREIPRTLSTLAPGRQHGVAADDYEVIVIDNGSPRPLPPAALETFPGALRVERIDPAPPSPARAANLGISLARAPLVGLVVDGARLTSPGILAGALAARCLSPRPVITAPAFHLGPVPHMRAHEHGYDQRVEDSLLASIDWEEDGYELFTISTEAGSGHRGLFGPMGESSSLFLPVELWQELDGLDERFTLPGGGLVNHDLYRRACALDGIQLIELLGEATFHQYHGGAATSGRYSWDDMHADYRAIRQVAYRPPANDPLYVGRVPRSMLPYIERSARRDAERRN